MDSIDKAICDNNLDLIKSSNIKDFYITEKQIIFLIKNNFHEILSLLLEKGSILAYFSTNILQFIVFRNRIKIIDVLIESKNLKRKGVVSFKPEDILTYACVYGRLKIVTNLVENKNISPTHNNNICFDRAYTNNQNKIISYLMNIKNVKNTLKKTHTQMYDKIIKLQLQKNLNQF